MSEGLGYLFGDPEDVKDASLTGEQGKRKSNRHLKNVLALLRRQPDGSFTDASHGVDSIEAMGKARHGYSNYGLASKLYPVLRDAVLERIIEPGDGTDDYYLIRVERVWRVPRTLERGTHRILGPDTLPRELTSGRVVPVYWGMAEALAPKSKAATEILGGRAYKLRTLDE